MLKERTVINECYILQTRIGEDSFTENWTATAIFSATVFLLRFLKNADNLSLCIDELRADALRCYRVRHQAIADFVEVEVYNGQLFISSEYHRERNLLSLFKKNPNWQFEQICIAILGLARGLSAFHGQGIIYGNLNAESVLSEEGGGRGFSALKIQKPPLLSLLSLAGSTKGALLENYAYIAPEYKLKQALCEGSDVYSLGIHMVRFFTGKLPFPESDDSLRAGSASLRYVTNALLRRGVPEALVRIVLLSLLSDPARRYASCADLMSDLRSFMESSDLGPADTSDYFKVMAGPEAEIKIDKDIVFPVKIFANQDKVDASEKEELTIRAEEQGWSVDDYLDNGKKTLAVEQGREYIVTARLSENLLVPEAETEPLVAVRTPADPPGVQASGTEAGLLMELNQIQLSREQDEMPLPWDHLRIRYQDVMNIVDLSIKRARKGKGSFRYIQEPPWAAQNASLFQSLEALKKECLYVNTGSCCGKEKADIPEFLGMLRNGLARSLSFETPNARRSLARRLSPLDPEGLFASSPLGRMLYGADGKDTGRNRLKTRECRRSIAPSLAVFGRKTRPLVLVIRGGECVTKDLHDLFSAIAREIRTTPVCVFVFFEHDRFESWHALSSLLPK